jgi:hypothetical protein
MINTQSISAKVHWLPEEEYAKAVGQLRLQLNGVMEVFMVYGQQPLVTQAIEEVVKLAEDFGLRVRGVDKPIALRKNFSRFGDKDLG